MITMRACQLKLTHFLATPGAHVGVSVCASRVFACYSLDNCSTQNFTVGAYRAVMNAALSTDLFDSGTTATTTATATTSTTTSPSTGVATDPACTSTQQASHGISTGAAAGIGVGVGLPLAIAVCALTFMLMREKKKSRDVQAGYQQQHHYSQQPYANASSPWGKSDGHHAPTVEAPGQMISHELSNIRDRHELGH